MKGWKCVQQTGARQQTLRDAKESCQKDISCNFIQHLNCKETGKAVLCKNLNNSKDIKKNKHQCVYKKL